MTPRTISPAAADRSRATARWERALVGILWWKPELWKQAATLKESDFMLSYTRIIFGAIAAISEHGQIADRVIVTDFLDRKFEVAEVGRLVAWWMDSADGANEANVDMYVRKIQECAQARKRSAELELELAELTGEWPGWKPSDFEVRL
jgi:replicative DNA helicase